MHHIYHMAVFLNLHVLTDNYVRAEIKSQADNQSQSHLSDNLKLAVQSFLILAEYFDIVVGKSQAA